MRSRRTGLRQNHDFSKLWIGQTVSTLGSRVTLVALPLTAALTLHAGAFEMGLLSAIQLMPYLFLTLLAGVWVDRLRRRPILIIADCSRALLLVYIPVAALLGILTLWQMYLIGLFLGIFTVWFDIAYRAFLPTIVARGTLIEANSKLTSSYSFAQVAGPGIAGALAQLLTASLALFVDAFSFIVSAACTLIIRTPERRIVQDHTGQRRRTWAELMAGLRLVLHHPLLRPTAAYLGTMNFFYYIQDAVYVLYITRALGLAPVLLGSVYAIGGVGSLLAAASAPWMARRFGFGRVVTGGTIVAGTGLLLTPLVAGASVVTVVVLALGQALYYAGLMLHNVNATSLWQIIPPDHLQGRVNATSQFLRMGTRPLGALLGGALGTWLGWRPTLVIGGLGILLAAAWVVCSDIRRLREPPRMTEDAAPITGGLVVPVPLYESTPRGTGD